MKKNRNGLLKISTVIIISMLLVSMIPVTSGEENSGNRGGEIQFEKEEGTESELFGGGNIVKIRFGNDAWFGVIYGTEDNPNSIVIASIAQRYLGVAEVYDSSGGLISKQYPIRVQSIFAMRMHTMLEFNDTNGNDICDFRRSGDGLDPNDFYKHEPIYKGVSLVTAWEQSEVTRTEGDNSTSWEFTLTATNLSYIDIGDVNTTGKVLDKLMFRFKITAHVNEVNRDVPVYRIHIQKVGNGNGNGNANGNENGNDENVKDYNETGTRNFQGKALSYSGKVDHDIEGWDFEEENNNPHLLLETLGYIGNRIPYGLAIWLKQGFISQIGGGGKTTFTNEDGTEEVMDEESAPSNGSLPDRGPRRLKNPRIESESNWEKVGRITWLTNVTLTNNGTEEEGEMYFQVQGHRHLTTLGFFALYKGYVFRGGFSYPAGEVIYHDPSMESSVTLLDIETINDDMDDGDAEDKIPGFGGIFGVIALIGVASVLLWKRRS